MSAVARPGHGRNGRETPVQVNHYELSFSREMSLLHYDVVCTPTMFRCDDGNERAPREPKGDDMIKIWKKLAADKAIPQFTAFDGGRACYSAQEISQEPIKVSLDASRPGRRPSNYTVVLTQVARVSLGKLADCLEKKAEIDGEVLAAIQALNVALAHTPRFELLTFGKLIFGKNSSRSSISGGLELRGGLFQTITVGEVITVNLDVSYTAFYRPGSLLSFIEGMDGAPKPKRQLSLRERARLTQLIKGFAVVASHQKSSAVMKIQSITEHDARNEVFDLKDKNSGTTNKISIADYYARERNIILQHPQAHCADCGRWGKIPLELLTIAPDTKHRGKLNESQTADTIKIAAKPPKARLGEIQSVVQKTIQYGLDPMLKNLGIRVQSSPMTVKGRMLDSPRVFYAGNNPVDMRDGGWNLRCQRVCNGAKIESFGVLYFEGESENCTVKFLKRFTEFSSRMGVCMPMPRHCPMMRVDQNGSIEQAMRRLYADILDTFQLTPQLIIVILRNTNSATYAEVKRVGDVVLGVCTQCVQSGKVREPKDPYLANVALKINVKCPGMPLECACNPNDSYQPFNSRVDGGRILEYPTMIVGFDVDHPVLGSSLPSIAAMVGSMDKLAVRFSPVVAAMPSRMEINGEVVESMMCELLSRFSCRAGSLPENILVYRDGVSDGEFDKVRDQEIAAMRRAFGKHGIKPKLSFVVAQKRHHTRFFPLQRTDKSGNVPAGFVLDRTITSPGGYDFFLQSQAGLQGTSRPTHYSVLLDEMKLSPDELQSFTFGLCHTQQRCTRAIGIVAPIFYADLLCTRARHYMRASDECESVSAGSNQGMLQVPAVHEMIRECMYYM